MIHSILKLAPKAEEDKAQATADQHNSFLLEKHFQLLWIVPQEAPAPAYVSFQGENVRASTGGSETWVPPRNVQLQPRHMTSSPLKVESSQKYYTKGLFTHPASTQPRLTRGNHDIGV